MAQTPTPGNHSFQRYNPWARYKTPATVTWGSTPTTCTITDDKISANSQLDTWVTGSTPQAGQWAYAITNGQCVITSSASEQSALTISYLIF